MVRFELPDLSFFFVQLAPYLGRDFTVVRNAQMAALQLPKTGYAVAIDLGDIHSPVSSIHPRRKQEVGRRLAISALSVQYGRAVTATGPLFLSMVTDASGMVATVAHVPGTALSLHAVGTADCDQVGSLRITHHIISPLLCAKHFAHKPTMAGGLTTVLRREPVPSPDP